MLHCSSAKQCLSINFGACLRNAQGKCQTALYTAPHRRGKSLSNHPATIGKYRIERELGRGASSIVYLAFDPFHGRRVAIKQIHAHLLSDPDKAERNRRRLRNEAILAGQMQHPHIVRLLDADEDANPPYLVLEYVDGVPLAAFTARDRLLPPA
ncbi:MAG: hypothetical protein EOO54_26110, partial [Haliea sp.]